MRDNINWRWIVPVRASLLFFVLSLPAASLLAASEDFQQPPTALDMMRELSGYLGGQVSSQDLFNLGVESNMRIPAEHLRVRFMDSRTGREMSRTEIDQLLGPARQHQSNTLLQQVFSSIEFPGIAAEQMIDLMNAAALASMRLPQNVSIEFYDARLGATGDTSGGVSGKVPELVYRPSSSVSTNEPGMDRPGQLKNK